MSAEYRITQTSYDEIYPIWRDYLWPDRVSEIRPYSIIKYMGGKNSQISKFANPIFYKLTLGAELVGVNSGHLTSEFEYRNRGIWIAPEHRGKSLSHIFFEQSVIDARSFGCIVLWSLPRKSAIKTYTSFGFQIKSDWDDESYEFGPNCFVELKI